MNFLWGGGGGGGGGGEGNKHKGCELKMIQGGTMMGEVGTRKIC